jgi:ABC-2 type transport system ATP-binding protein
MLHIETLSERERAQALLTELPGVGHVYTVNGGLEVEFLGDDESTAELLQRLLAEGVRVLSFHEVTTDLEEVFLRLTKGEVA